MMKEEILAMKAEELRQKIGEGIFGYTVETRKGFRSFGDGTFIEDQTDRIDAAYAFCYIADRWKAKDGEEVLVWEELPNYPEDISAAWQVLEKLKKEWGCITLLWDVGSWDIILESYDTCKTFFLGKESGLTYKELPEAICKAALLAKLKEGYDGR